MEVQVKTAIRAIVNNFFWHHRKHEKTPLNPYHPLGRTYQLFFVCFFVFLGKDEFKGKKINNLYFCW